jgi:hypothetical protein
MDPSVREEMVLNSGESREGFAREEMILESAGDIEVMTSSERLRQRKKMFIIFYMCVFIVVNITLTVLVSSMFYIKLHDDKPLAIDEVMYASNGSMLNDLVTSTSHNHTNYCIKQFKLPNSNKRISVCLYEGEIRVDIRVFLFNKPTIKGIYLSVSEWKEFDRMHDVLSRLLRPLIS